MTKHVWRWEFWCFDPANWLWQDTAWSFLCENTGALCRKCQTFVGGLAHCNILLLWWGCWCIGWAKSDFGKHELHLVGKRQLLHISSLGIASTAKPNGSLNAKLNCSIHPNGHVHWFCFSFWYCAWTQIPHVLTLLPWSHIFVAQVLCVNVHCHAVFSPRLQCFQMVSQGVSIVHHPPFLMHLQESRIKQTYVNRHFLVFCWKQWIFARFNWPQTRPILVWFDK